MKVDNHRGTTVVHIVDNLSDSSFADSPKPTLLIVDQDLFFLLNEFLPSLVDDDIHVIKVKSCEDTKSLEFASSLLSTILNEFGLPRQIITFGGGALQDLSGFLAGLFRRGIKWSFIPTTLLSMADSCIGSKISINVIGRKNQIGFFYAPSEVYICTHLLKSLPRREYLSGCGDILHYALQEQSINPIFTEYLPNLYSNFDTRKLDAVIKATINIKKDFIRIDEFDTSRRRNLNLGHTFGHAIESASNYLIPHGIAVIIGCSLAFHASSFFLEDFLLSSYPSHCDLINQLLYLSCESFGSVPIDFTTFLSALASDKKNPSPDIICFILPSVDEFGSYNIHPYQLPFSNIESFLLHFLSDGNSFRLDSLLLDHNS